jgi:transcriptional regulator with XRE-family HTH domain
MKFTAKELRMLRQSRNMQQKNVACKMKISLQRYSILENDDDRPVKRTIEILQILDFNERTAREFLDLIPQ